MSKGSPTKGSTTISVNRSFAENLSLVYPSVPIDATILKKELRNGLQNNDSRLYWWPFLTRLPRNAVNGNNNSNTMISKYPDIVSTAESLPKRMNEPLIDYKYQLKYDGNKPEAEFITTTLKKLMYLLSSQKLIDTNDEHAVFCFEPMARLIIYHMRRIDLSYMVASDILADKEKYLNPGYDAHSAMLNTFREMLQNFMPKTYQQLSVMGALDEKYLDLIFVGIFTEILPPDVVLRIMDAFLYEGVKILYRYGLALIRGYKTQIKSGKYQTATDFWLHIKADACAFSSDPALSRTSAAMATNSDGVMTGKVGEGALGPPGWGMLFRSIGLEDVLPTVDPFLIFAKAKNPDLLRSNAMMEYPYDIGRSVFEKMFRPMSVSSSSIKSSMKRQGSITGDAVGSKLQPASADSASRKGSLSTLTRKESVDYTRTAGVNSSVRSASMGARRGSGTNPTPRSSVTAAGQSESDKNNDLSKAMEAMAAIAANGTVDEGGAKGPANEQDEEEEEDIDKPEAPNAAEEDIGAAGGLPTAGFSTPEVTRDTVGSSESDLAAKFLCGMSNILSLGSARTLLDYLPLEPFEVDALSLVYNSEANDRSLPAVYSHVGGASPCVLLIEVTLKSSGTAVLGAYVASTISPSAVQQTSDSSTLCFRLDDVNAVCYGNSTTATEGKTVFDAILSENMKDVAAATDNKILLVKATEDVLSIGLSSDVTSSALSLTADLKSLYISSSDIMKSAPLLRDEESDASDESDGIRTAQILRIEIYSNASPSTGFASK